MKITRVGLDIAKQVFHAYGVDEHGKKLVSRKLSRHQVLEYFVQLPPCLIGMEACAGAHYWAREFRKQGHTVKLMAGQFVKPYCQGGKNDANDAQGICEAVGRPGMHFVAVKSEEQQAVLMVHRARSLVVSNRTALGNQIRGQLGEFGIVVPQGVNKLYGALPQILEDAQNGLPSVGREVLGELLEEFRALTHRLEGYDRQIERLAKHSEAARRLMKLEGVGPLTATAVVASIGDVHAFKSGRNYAASLGMVPRQNSSGGKTRLGSITKRGDGYVRKLLVHGARAYLRTVDKKTDRKSAWVRGLKQRRHANVAAVALAAKHARIIWAMLAHGTQYQPARAEQATA